MAHFHRLRAPLQRFAFALLLSAVAVVFSEKMYWYVTGYGLLDLLLGYFFPSYIVLWIIDAFRVRRLAPLFLAAAVFGFVAEGVLVGTIYEGGPMGLFSISYTPLAWHAPLTVLFGWWWLGRRLAAGSLRRLAAGCAAVGLFWGLWSLAWWLPENAADPALLAQGARLGQWPPAEFALHALAFTGLLALAHWLLGRGGRMPSFRPGRLEAALVIGGLLFFYAGVVIAVPWAPLKLLPLLALTLGALAANKRREPPGSLLAEPRGRARPAALAALFVMPAVAVGVYALAAAVALPAGAIYVITAVGLVLGPAVLGGLAWLAALGWTIKRNAS
ncbi:MAG: hypothetical protein KA170_02085 [Candidatus Promineofilum sp.]|nr:hypothetical protein [Promineifilum sp.]